MLAAARLLFPRDLARHFWDRAPSAPSVSRACDLPRPRCAALAAGKYPSTAHSHARVLSSARFNPRGRVPRTKRLYAARCPPIAEPAQGIWRSSESG